MLELDSPAHGRQLPVCVFVRVRVHTSLSDGIYAESKDSI